MGTCDPGLKESITLRVEHRHCADEIGSGDVPVLGTPEILALAERACTAAIAHDLPDGKTSVGSWAEIEHRLPTAVGHEVHADATLIGHHNRRLEFNITVRDDDDEVVAKIRHRRVLVDRGRFLAKVHEDEVHPGADA